MRPDDSVPEARGFWVAEDPVDAAQYAVRFRQRLADMNAVLTQGIARSISDAGRGTQEVTRTIRAAFVRIRAA